MTTTPKLLPWLAHSAGLSDARVEELWREASHYARNATGEFETPKYWKTAHVRLINLIQAEAFAHNPPETAPWVMIQTNLGNGLLTLTDFLAEVSANLRAWFARGTKPAV